MIKCISAITLATHDMARAVRFYRALGFEITDMIANGNFFEFVAQEVRRIDDDKLRARRQRECGRQRE